MNAWKRGRGGLRSRRPARSTWWSAARSRAGRALVVLSGALGSCTGGVAGGAIGGDAGGGPDGARSAPADTVRVATFNVEELSAEKVDSIDAAGVGAHPQLLAAAEVLRRVRPDVLVINEVDLARVGYGLDHDDLGRVVRDFRERYLEVGDDALVLPHLYVAPSNTGILTGVDLNGDGVVATPDDAGTREHGEDAFGFGVHPGQYAMAVLSRFPIDARRARTFRLFRWRDLPGHNLPEGFYSDTAVSLLRLSSKSHWDVPVLLGADTVHLLVSHPTPPVFDGPENRNGRRNFDEIGFWARYLDDSPALTDDAGGVGGLSPGRSFVLAGDLNAAPEGGEAALGDTPAISQLLDHPRVVDPPWHRGRRTAVFLGGIRVDYLLPSRDLRAVDGGVFDPPADVDPEGATTAAAASDHRLVWLDLLVAGRVRPQH